MPRQRWCAPRPIWAEARRCSPRGSPRSKTSISFGPIDLSAQAKVEALQAALAQSRAPLGRVGDIQMQRASVAASRAALDMAEWRLAQRRVSRAGGWARGRRSRPPGRNHGSGRASRIAAASRQHLRAVLCSGSGDLATVHHGDLVTLACDGCPADLSATISFVSPQAEYTPPLIYSEFEQVQAGVPDRSPAAAGPGSQLNPGEPMEVRPVPPPNANTIREPALQ